MTDGLQQVGLDVLTERKDVVVDRCWNRLSEDELGENCPHFLCAPHLKRGATVGALR